ncbi:hypothetical protein JKP88DRAFT_346317 [Tribonema minus]|uniref:Plastid lipid-associated protein/fibrillin conserved domain-containing protein n=1 Tax=Tribonema minus TaxID=303371 RepID=A0A836CPL4_9STRA|nr:hypothetical protein JKP88DRAFT_346317 [Tribonema minus]
MWPLALLLALANLLQPCQGLLTASVTMQQSGSGTQIRSLKQLLVRSLVGLDRGIRGSPAACKAVLGIVEELEQLNPTPAPCAGFDTRTSKVAGAWSLLFSDAPDVTLLGALPGVEIGTVKSVQLRPMQLAGLDMSFAPALRAAFPTFAQRTGWFDTLYVDDDLWIIMASDGSNLQALEQRLHRHGLPPMLLVLLLRCRLLSLSLLQQQQQSLEQQYCLHPQQLRQRLMLLEQLRHASPLLLLLLLRQLQLLPPEELGCAAAAGSAA